MLPSLTLAIVFADHFPARFCWPVISRIRMVLAGAVLISAFVSLSLTPVLNIYLTKKDPTKHSWFYRKTEPFFSGLENGYRRALQGFMKARWVAFVIVIACAGIIYFIGSSLPFRAGPIGRS